MISLINNEKNSSNINSFFNIQFFAENSFGDDPKQQDEIKLINHLNESENVNDSKSEDDSCEISEELNFETGEKVSTPQKESFQKSFLKTIFDMLEVFSYAVALMIIVFLFVIKFVTVEGTSMLYTLQDDDRLIIYNLFYTPETNDVIVINYEPRNELLVKRIIGVEGDKVKINFSTWEIWVNDKYLEQPYLDMNPDKGIIPMKQGNLVDVDENNCIEFTVEEGKVFVLGDNRNGSSDSRVFGQLDADEIMGKVIFRVFPFESAGAIE